MPKPTTSEEIRRGFLRFFEEKQHEVVPSASLVPQNDPTVFFTIAGMVQFKDVFLGTGTRPYTRAVDTQKILRVSGKHNDLEEVGHDTSHLTFFEMLGNWSFGDYFKKEAISWAWELLVDHWGIDPGRLYATVHEGDEKWGLDADEEAASLWKSETSIDPDHILFFDSKDNFWMMGDTGPCGPCSEIHIDLRSEEDRKEVDGKTLVNADHSGVVEIWNLVFIQYNAMANGSLQQLASKHVDTGMGFERTVAALQGKSSMYDTDLFEPLFQRIAELSPLQEVDAYDEMKGVDENTREKYRVAMRVVADHSRTCAFAIADGVSPGNAGRSYVIRRILRRAVRYGYQTLGLRQPFMYQLVASLVDKMGTSFPELVEQKNYIERVIKAEEEGFLETLGMGLGLFDTIIPYVSELKKNPDSVDVLGRLGKDAVAMDLLRKAYSSSDKEGILEEFGASASRGYVPGDLAFLLHDTYGFPVDLTQLMVREQGLLVDMDAYTVRMTEQKERARAASMFGNLEVAGDDAIIQVSDGHDSEFVGYDTLVVDNAAIRRMQEFTSDDVTRFEVVLDRTPFYAESGGQLGDTGVLVVGEEKIHVLDTKKKQDQIVHLVDRLPEEPGKMVRAEVDSERRSQVAKHHTATHLLHAALREILGSHVGQKGSLVAPDRLRFDFSHFERITNDQLRRIERRVNKSIQQNIPRIEERSVPIDDALSRGATALFGEKYGDAVRVITFDPSYSIELCGGTHVDATGALGIFRFLSEGSVAAGVRRVEAVVGEAALEYVDNTFGELERVKAQFKVLNGPVDKAIAQLMDESKRLEKEIARSKMQDLEGNLEAFIKGAQDVKGLRLITGRFESLDMESLRTLGQTLRERAGENAVSVLGTVDPEGGKAYLVAAVTDDVIKANGVKAGAIVGTLAKKVGGGGGGKPALATAGGKKPEHLDEALDAAAEVLASML